MLYYSMTIWMSFSQLRFNLFKMLPLNVLNHSDRDVPLAVL